MGMKIMSVPHVHVTNLNKLPYGYQLWKEQAKCESMQHQNRTLCEQCFPDRIRSESFSSQHRLGAESPPCLVSRSQTACTWRKSSGYVRLVISCLGGRKQQHKRKGFQNISSVLVQQCVTVRFVL